MSNTRRSISVKNTSLLLTKAGGRCSFNYNGEFCNKVLADGRVNLGEKAHIVGVRGPRSEYQVSDLNDYDNLIWLCQDHHTIIDHPSNLSLFTVQELKQMKFRHEEKIRTGKFPYFGTVTSLHDFSSLSTLFLFLDIHSLYGNISTYPNVNINFYDVEEVYADYCKDNPPNLVVYDPLLKDRFNRFLESYYELANHLRCQPNVEEDILTGWFTKSYDEVSYQKVCIYLEDVEALISLINGRFPQILQQDLYRPFD